MQVHEQEKVLWVMSVGDQKGYEASPSEECERNRGRTNRWQKVATKRRRKGEFGKHDANENSERNMHAGSKEESWMRAFHMSSSTKYTSGSWGQRGAQNAIGVQLSLPKSESTDSLKSGFLTPRTFPPAALDFL